LDEKQTQNSNPIFSALLKHKIAAAVTPTSTIEDSPCIKNQENSTGRIKSNSRNEIMKALLAKSKFKSDSMAEKALRILIYKRREQR